MKKLSIALVFLLAILFNANAQIGVGRRPTTSTSQPQSEVFDYANPKEYIIGGVTSSGSKYYDANSMISISGLREGDKIQVPGAAISDAVKKLMDQGILENVEISATKIEGDKIFLNIHLKERPRLYKILFSGIKKGEQDGLNDKVKLIKGKIITETLIKNAELAIKRYFTEKGHLNVKIKTIQLADSARGNNAALRFIINKGEKVKIHQIIINGRTEMEEGLVRRKMKGTKQMRFGRIFTPSKFIPKKFDEDKEKLIEFYNKKGYRDARIAFDTVYAHDNRTVDVVLNLEEGRKYYYRSIRWEGNFIRPDSVLNEVLNIKKGDVYDTEELAKRINGIPQNDVSSLYMDDGYLFFQAEPEEAVIENDSIDLVIRISEGKQATINKIILNGNTKTSDHVVMREIRTLPGQKFSKSAIIRTQRELATLGYFDPEKIGIVPIPHQDGTVDIEYTVEEKPSDQIELSGGWGGYVGFVGTLGVVFNNFSARNIGNLKAWRPLPAGDGQKMAVRFQANGQQFQNYSLTFTEPWLGGKKPNSFSISLNKSVYYPYKGGYTSLIYGSSLSEDDKNAHFNSLGITFSLGRRLKRPDDYFTMSNALSLQSFDVYKLYQGYYPTGKSTSITFNTTISRNSLDNPQFTRRGSSFTLSATFTPPYSMFSNKTYSANDPEKYRLLEYHKWMFDASWFTPIFGKFVLHARAHMGFLGSYNSSLGIVPFERFVLGGSGMVYNNFQLSRDIVGLRGYKDQVIGPLDRNNTSTGGVVYNKFVAELRYPVSLNPSATIFVLSFMEAGNNWGSYKEYNPFSQKRSAGFGARIFMPAFGMIGIDWAYGFDKVPGYTGTDKANGAQFHFTIGQQIR
ncbi:MAG: outer membrane protein assembly factor BamA [Spirosomataceae bacterium]